jgi:hypothetical protein
LDFQAEHRGTVPSRSVDEVPLREYADRFHPPIFDHQGANAMLGQPAHRKLDAVGGVYLHNVMAFDRNRGKSPGSGAFFSCADSTLWILCIMCRCPAPCPR